VWLDTPAAPPGAEPVVQALREVVSAWSSGGFDQHAWDAARGEARGLFARLVGADPATVSTHGSVAEAAATVAGVRFGFHSFNDDRDVSATLRVLDREHRSGSSWCRRR
jgi:selenocysteine lyase/cysteine desulfurase